MRIPAILLCLLAGSCGIVEPDAKVIDVHITNNSDVALEDFWAYTLNIGELAVSEEYSFQITTSLEDLYRSGSHQIGFIADSISFRCYGPLITAGSYAIEIALNPENGLFNVFIEGQGRNVSAEIYFTELTN